eukprot:167128-Chlamydomonas_euryale.AAC.18
MRSFSWPGHSFRGPLILPWAECPLPPPCPLAPPPSRSPSWSQTPFSRRSLLPSPPGPLPGRRRPFHDGPSFQALPVPFLVDDALFVRVAFPPIRCFALAEPCHTRPHIAVGKKEPAFVRTELCPHLPPPNFAPCPHTHSPWPLPGSGSGRRPAPGCRCPTRSRCPPAAAHPGVEGLGSRVYGGQGRMGGGARSNRPHENPGCGMGCGMGLAINACCVMGLTLNKAVEMAVEGGGNDDDESHGVRESQCNSYGGVEGGHPVWAWRGASQAGIECGDAASVSIPHFRRAHARAWGQSCARSRMGTFTPPG